MVGELAVVVERRPEVHQRGPRPQRLDRPSVRLALGAGQFDDDSRVGDQTRDAAAERLGRVVGLAEWVEEEVPEAFRNRRDLIRVDAHRGCEEPPLTGARAEFPARLGAEDLAVLGQPGVQFDRALVAQAVSDAAAGRGERQHPPGRDESRAARADLASVVPDLPDLLAAPPDAHERDQTQQHVEGLAYPVRDSHRLLPRSTDGRVLTEGPRSHRPAVEVSSGTRWFGGGVPHPYRTVTHDLGPACRDRRGRSAVRGRGLTPAAPGSCPRVPRAVPPG